MAHLSGVETKRTVESIEVVSDDALRVFRFERTTTGVTISERKAHQSYWDTTTIATLNKKDASLLNTLLGGGSVYSDETYTELASRNQRHVLPDPEPAVDEAEQARCAELDIERAKAANIEEAKELLRLENIRDHQLDRHITASVEGCPKCEDRFVSPALAPNDPVDRMYAEAFDSQDPNDPSSVAFGSVGNVDAPDEELPF